jgi:hypothetical protein
MAALPQAVNRLLGELAVRAAETLRLTLVIL